MKTSGKQILIFSCLLFICSFAHSGLSKEERFHLLSHYNNASLVEDSLKLATSSSGLVASTLINYGLWYSICKAPGVVAALTGRFAGAEQNELQRFKSSFCNQLAAVLTSTEIALAGRVSPWPLETPWWQPLRFVATAYNSYEAYNTMPDLMPIITAGYFTSQVVTRTVAGGTAIWGLRDKHKSTIQPFDKARTEYSMLSSITGTMVGAIVYKKIIAAGFSRKRAIFGYLVFQTLVERISAISSLSIHNSGIVDLVRTEASAEDLAAHAALAGSWAAAVTGADAIRFSSNAVLGMATIATAISRTPSMLPWYSVVGILVGLEVGGEVGSDLSQQIFRLDSDHLLRSIALTLRPALAIAVINAVPNNAVYGYSLKESFTETVRTQWQKFYAPLDYLRTLFN
ncbi:hypothetical protein [Endozoicomonas sp. 4G]|uniref:hypothetical protein n=1 Tax=Endozoicomonas sp. 4G TaxID=2872754 RepID=UPI0020789EB0|nr:hypothetical protein [Endozoicomonas sp. 4G]